LLSKSIILQLRKININTMSLLYIVKLALFGFFSTSLYIKTANMVL